MKIIKYSSRNDIERIAKYMINVMAAARIFDEEGKYLGSESASGFPVFSVNDVEYSTKASSACIYYTKDVLRKTFTHENPDNLEKEFAKLITAFILSLEKQYGLNYCFSRYKTVFNSAQTCIKVKPSLPSDVTPYTKEGPKEKKSKDKKRMLSKNFEIKGGSSNRDEKSVAEFEWHLAPTSRSELEIKYHDNEQLVKKNIAAVYLDANNTLVLGDNEFIPVLRYEHFTAQTNTITAEEILISQYVNPLSFYLNLEWRNAPDCFRKISYGRTKASYMFRRLLKPVYEVEYSASLFQVNTPLRLQNTPNVAKEQPVTENEVLFSKALLLTNSAVTNCMNCRSMLFDDVYVLLSRLAGNEVPFSKASLLAAPVDMKTEMVSEPAVDNQKLILCPLCLHLSLYPFECEYKYTLRTKIPTTVHDVIDLSVAPSSHKEAMHVLAGIPEDEINLLKQSTNNVIELGEPDSSNGYAIMGIFKGSYGRDNSFDIIKESGFGGKKIIKAMVME